MLSFEYVYIRITYTKTLVYCQIRIVKSNVSFVDRSSERNRDVGPTLETSDFTIRIVSTPTFIYTCYSVHSLRRFLVVDAQIIDEHFLSALLPVSETFS